MNMWMRCVLLGLLCSTIANVNADVEPTFITIASGRVHGNYYNAARAICNRVNLRQKAHGIRCSVAYSDGSVANITSIRAGEYELGIVQSDAQYYAVNGTGVFGNRTPFIELRSLFSLHPEALTIIAHPDQGIHTLKDLRGKRIDMGSPGSGSRGVAEAVLKESGMRIQDFREVVSLDIIEQIAAFCEFRLDAMLLTVGHPNQTISETMKLCAAIFVAPEKEVVEKLVAKRSYFIKTLIPGKLYKGNLEPLTTVGVRATLVTSANFPKRMAYEVVKSVFSDIDSFKESEPVLSDLNPRKMVTESLTAPIHDGAMEYFNESGLLDVTTP